MVIDHLRRGMMNPPNKYMPTKTREPTVEAVTREGKAEANGGIYLIQMPSLTMTTFEISGFQMSPLITTTFEFLYKPSFSLAVSVEINCRCSGYRYCVLL